MTPTARAGFSTPYVTSAYLAPDEFPDYVTAIDTGSLVPDGSDAANRKALEHHLRRASGIIDSHCDQILAASLDVEMRRSFMNRSGEIILHPDNWPILELRDLEYGSSPSLMQALANFDSVFIEEHAITVSMTASRWSSAGPLDIGAPFPGASLFVRYSYVNGWPNTALAAAATAGASVLTVVDATGIYGGPSADLSNALVPPSSRLTIYDGGSSENVTIASVAGSVLTLNAPLVSNHGSGACVSALPMQVKEACALIAVSLIQTRGDVALVMGALRSGGEQSKSGPAQADLTLARELLSSFRRVL